MSGIKKLWHLVALVMVVAGLLVVPGCDLWVDGTTADTGDIGGTTTLEPIGGWQLTTSPEPWPVTDWVDAVKRAKPAVVAINVEIETQDIFGRPIVQPGAGTGWIIDADGIIVTNAHVVEGATRVEVILDDGRSFNAEGVWSDAVSDLAVVKIPAQNLPVAKVYNYNEVSLEVGQPVAALGNALGEGISMKGGWVSQLDVSLPVDGAMLYGLIETDAAINPGNSGGPLINLAGEVIGITSAKMVSVDVEGVAYAIPVTSAIPIIENLVNLGYVVRPYLGVEGLLTVSPAVALYFGLGVEQGVLIQGVASGSPADKAGLQRLDVIVKVDGETVNTAQELQQIIYSKEIGQEVEITYYRGAQERVTTALLAETPPPG